MAPKSWLFKISVVALLIFGCKETPMHNCGHAIDSIGVIGAVRLDSAILVLDSMRSANDGLAVEVASLRDSIVILKAALDRKNPSQVIRYGKPEFIRDEHRVRYGGEAKGDPIRPNDPPRRKSDESPPLK